MNFSIEKCHMHCIILYAQSLWSMIYTGSCGMDGAVRLADGKTSSEGRVEICSNGVWGTVSSSGWDSREGTVFCRQLGFQNPSG